tara:strand:- start:283 stop:453 length:171 start_codon:yes stop_codon:yes gene_type:complete
MEEIQEDPPKRELTYYQKNRKHYKKGGKYYKYKPIDETRPKIELNIKRGEFILSFD